MIKPKSEGIILEKTQNDFEQKGVFNPGCIKAGEITHMFYRAVNKDGVSSIGYCQLLGNKVIQRLDKPVLFPEYDFEKKGVEDPRIVFLEGTYFLFYTAYDGKSATVAYATSHDLKDFSKKGLLFPKISYDEAEDIFRNSPNIGERYIHFEKMYRYWIDDKVLLWEKDAFLFPKKIKGKFALMHRILPGIQICYFDNFSELDINFWKNYLANLGKYIVLDPTCPIERGYIGGGCPPIETSDGWLLIYHSVEEIHWQKTYRASVALLDKDNPQKVLSHPCEPLLSPTEEWERKGNVDNVVFPTGAVVDNEILYIYYGAADTCIGAKSVNLNDLLSELKTNKNNL